MQHVPFDCISLKWPRHIYFIFNILDSAVDTTYGIIFSKMSCKVCLKRPSYMDDIFRILQIV